MPYSNLIDKIASLQADQVNYEKQHVTLLDDGSIKVLNDDPYIKIPPYNPSTVAFVHNVLCEPIPEDVPVFSKIIMGPYGSGKTSAIVQAILRDAILMPFCDDGTRRYRIAIVRNTAGELETTTLKTWEFWTQGLPMPHRSKKPVFTLKYKLRDEYGVVNLEVMLLALDRMQDFKKLASLELTAAYFNECQFIPEFIYDTMQDRTKTRYPARIEFIRQYEENYADKVSFEEWIPYQSKIYGDTNAPDEDHWIADIDKGKRKSGNIKIYHQPPALLKNEDGEWEINHDADNISNVGSHYYLDMINRTEEYIRVYAQGKYGTAVDGAPVYPAYNDDIHSVDDLGITEDETIYLGIDYGKTSPGIVLIQYISSQVRCIKEFIGENITIKELYRASVIPFFNTYCKGLALDATGDPANTDDGKGQLEECGIDAENAITNKIDVRIAAVSNILNELSGGKPRLLVSRAGCPKLRAGFIGKYHYRRLKIIGEDRYQSTPYKNHPYSDVHDGLQYVVMKLLDIQVKPVDDFDRRQFLDRYHEKTRSEVTGY